MERWGVGVVAGGVVFPYRDAQGAVCAQKIRSPDKNFFVVGDLKQAVLFGRHLWRGSGSRIYVTEGEVDAMTIDQAMGTKWPVVSIPNGASGARKALAANLEYLNQYEKVVLCFDMDEPGRDAVEDCVGLFKAGKVHIVHLPLKDASDMMQADRTAELVKALWDAPVYRPEGLLSVNDLRKAANTPPEAGLPWCYPTLNSKTYGRRMGELVVIAAGAGAGKSAFIQQQAVFDMDELSEPVAMFAFEQHPVETLQRITGQGDGKFYHVWDDARDGAAFDKACDRLEPRLTIYDHMGNSEWDYVRERIRFLVHSKGCRLFYIDNMTALCDQGDNERASIDKIIKEMANLTRELNIWICLVSHCSSPQGTAHEEGGRIEIKHLRGSRAMGIWPSFVFALERNQQTKDPTTVRGLKDRYLGRALGEITEVVYDHKRNIVSERLAMAPIATGADAPF